MRQVLIFLIHFMGIAVSDYLFGLPGIAIFSFLVGCIIHFVNEKARSILVLAITTAIWSLALCMTSSFGNGKMMVTRTAALFGLPHYSLLIFASTLFAVSISASACTVGLEIGRLMRNQRLK